MVVFTEYNHLVTEHVV